MTARILLLDIETAPMEADVWGMWKNNVGLNQLVKDWYILSWSAKWLGVDKPYYADQRNVPLDQIEDDSAILAKLHALLDQADVVVAHNAARFDVPKINARFIKAGFLPPSPYKIIDTLLIAKKQFKFSSNRLEYLAKFLDVPQKKLAHHRFPGHALWTAVRKGNKQAWAEMKTYNIADVYALEGVYLKLRPWDKLHPNVAVTEDSDEHLCPTCGSVHVTPRGFTHTNVGKYQRYVCGDCGSWSRSRYTENSNSVRKALLGK